jgi:hypothetical protein
MKENYMKIDRNSLKLPQLLDIPLFRSNRNNFSPIRSIAIYSYYLWFLIDNGLIVVDVSLSL